MLGNCPCFFVGYFITLLSNSDYTVSNFGTISWEGFGRKQSFLEVQSLHLMKVQIKPQKGPEQLTAWQRFESCLFQIQVSFHQDVGVFTFQVVITHVSDQAQQLDINCFSKVNGNLVNEMQLITL